MSDEPLGETDFIHGASIANVAGAPGAPGSRSGADRADIAIDLRHRVRDRP